MYISKEQEGVCVCIAQGGGAGGNACQDTLDFSANVSDGWKDE